ncbi:MAG TPA: carboxypeptidase regulatory-like domain-containing protein [Vicinamibacterales bacterium]|nr:carboxypeptidase regulatory-like domain-containing protein [Vicinamibacterales bacterium]
MFIRPIALILSAVVAFAAPAAAQNISSASIDGVVTDDTGAALPGVSVTITSQALQVPQLVQTTDGAGHYRFIDLPRGSYSLRFEIQGFDPLIRPNLEVNAGFAARVNVSMKIGSLQETVTVSGASPVVDLTTTRGGQNVSTDLISIALPGLKQMADVIVMTPGLHSTDGYKPGAIGLNGRSRFNTYGIDSGNTNVTVMVDGFKIIANSQPDFANSVETDVKTYGNSAEVKEAGALINVITKSGGNDFHGRYSDFYMRQPQSNLTSELAARGLSVGTSLRYYNDVFGDLGGRLVRDRVWFFGSMRDRRNQTTRPGLVLNPGPDGVYLTGDEPAALPKSTLDNPTIKGTFQLTSKLQMVGDYAREVTNSDADYQKTIFGAQPTSNPDFTHIAFEATQAFRWVPTRWKFELKGTPTNHLLFDAQFGRSTYLLDYTPQTACGNTPPTYDRNTLLLSGCAVQQQTDFTMWVGDGSMTWVPSTFLGGSHEFKMGYQLSARDITGNAAVTPQGNYALMFDLVNGVRQGVQFETSNAPVNPANWDNVYSGYFADQWRLGQRLTFNLGLRYDYQHAYVPEQTREAGPWADAATYPRVEVGRWGRWAPRAAVAFDLTGSGKTVAKASYGWFNTEGALAANYNQLTIFTTDYRWHDLNNDGRYQPGEVNLNTNGADFLSTTSAANTPPNPDLLLSNYQEVSASIERELAPNLAARVLYVLKRSGDDIATSVNTLRPFSAYNIPIQRRDPGPDGTLGTGDDGGLVTIYDYDPAYRGSNFVNNQTVNRPDGRSDYFNSFEGSVTRRLAGSWSLLAAYTATKYHKWLVGYPQSPNDTAFDLDDRWRWNLKLNGNYNLPHDFLVGAIVEVVNGALGQRTYVFRATDPSGPPLRQLATVSLRLEPYGAQSEPAQTQFNARVGKKFAFNRKVLNVSFDVLNVTNSSAITSVTYVSGPSFGRVTDILPPRTLRAGVTFDF